VLPQELAQLLAQVQELEQQPAQELPQVSEPPPKQLLAQQPEPPHE
jgi:hypothetical protein